MSTLPDNYPIHLENEARVYYQKQGIRPPFLLKKESRSRDRMRRSLILATASGDPSTDPTEVIDIEKREWDKDNLVWTLDINNTRYIVKSFSGQ